MDLLRLTVPEQVYITDELLNSICKYIEDNYCYEEDALVSYGISHRYYHVWKSLEQKGDEKAEYILIRLDSAVTNWVNKVQREIMTSNDTRSKSYLLPSIKEDRKQRREERLNTGSDYVDEWV